MFYLLIEDKLHSYSDYKFDKDCKETDIITVKDLDKHPKKVIVDNGVLVINPNWESEHEKEVKEIVSHLKCTKRVLALILQQLGISYNRLKELIATNEQAQLEWDLCIELERCNPLLDIMGEKLGLTPEQIDQMFKYANGWVDTLEVE